MSAALLRSWRRRVSDYHGGDGSAAERAAVEAHLATCADCREALAAYRRFYDLARSPLRLGPPSQGIVAVDKGAVPVEGMMTDVLPRRHPPGPTGSPRERRPALWGAIAAAVVLGLLAATFAGQLRQRGGPVARPSPTPRLATPPAVVLPPLAAFPGWHAVLRFGAASTTGTTTRAATSATTSATSGSFSVAGPYAIDIDCIGSGTVTVKVDPEVSFSHTCGPTPVLEHDEYTILKSAAHVRRTLSASAIATGNVTWEVLIEVQG